MPDFTFCCYGCYFGGEPCHSATLPDMPYSRRRRFSRRGPVRRRRTPRRTTYRRRRVYRRRGGMSRRRVLNISSTKKHDNMLPFVRDASEALVGGPMVIGPANASQSFLFCPTARIPNSSNGTSNNESYRERSTVYARGFRETINIWITDGIWKWRRIVFETKQLRLLGPTGQGVYDTSLSFYDSPTQGMTRVMSQLAPNTDSSLRGYIFDGQEGNDWIDPFTAKTDRDRVKVHSDRTWNFNNSSGEGQAATRKLWYPFNKTFTYNDDENGKTGPLGNIYQYFCTQGPRGMGDVFVYDIVQRVVGDGQMRFSPEGTYYWHER